MKKIHYMVNRQPLASAILVIIVCAILMFSTFVVGMSILENQVFAQSIAMFVPSILIIIVLIKSNVGIPSHISNPLVNWEKNWWIIFIVMFLIVITVAVVEGINFSELVFDGGHTLDWLLVNSSTGMFEELLFRGACFYILYRVWGRTRKGLFLAAATQALIFGLLHFGNLHRSDLIQVIHQVSYSIFIGFGLAGLVAYSRSIWPAVLIHFSINAASSLDNFFAGPNYNFTETDPNTLLIAVAVFFLCGFIPGAWCLLHAQLASQQTNDSQADDGLI